MEVLKWVKDMHTKVAATAFNIPLSSVTCTQWTLAKLPNASPTAASASSDMYGPAVLDDVNHIIAKLEPVTSKHNFNTIR
ncbi:Aldehyde oxidase/xanthine dehydrogenase molybdopterin binding [Arabidopsis thaliana x Arabidopsis arenosa]|uniref:Aldehyde oxidase/xanthine dehydrogenase molybdopterin binding n=1 Tax=Arabidopsis thaliana x Arabidopsis arenosa TaxID=1240361 RepID=A0A8T2EIX5_9BRAS|nr:Aldehyde oxidase/xanthine dehydrogenase molybdopterin binding [Arabidopsis thaliana x Arabidopsis arenosa]